jgi:hypothetical protein
MILPVDQTGQEAQSNFFIDWWGEVRPIAVAWLVDLAKNFMFWTGVTIAHFLQTYFLSRGWDPQVVHFLDLAEEGLVSLSILAFLIESAAAWAWPSYKRLRNLK